jgi:hypothetical protein
MATGGGEMRGGGAGASHRRGALLAAAAVLALTAGAVALLVHLDRNRLAERSVADAQSAALRAADGVRNLIGGIEVQAQNATTNPRLVAALDANVDQETLRDLLLTEPWWEPFRRSVDGYGLYNDENTAEVTSRLPASFDPRALVRDARQGHHATSGLLVASGQLLAVAACPVALTGRSEWPVLVATRVIDVGLLSGMADRAGGAVAISDGRRLLVAANGNASGGSDDLSALKQAIALPAPGLVALETETVAVLPLSDGLRIMVGVMVGGPALTSAAPAGPGGMPVPWSAIAILVMGLALSVGLFLMLARPSGAPSPADDTPLASGEDDPAAPLGAIGRYTIVDRIGQGGMSEIYAAVTTGEGSFRRPVVIKRLRPELSIDPNAVAQFCDEANLLAALHHPNIVSVHDFGRSQNQYFLAEEYMAGRDLGRVIARRFARADRPPPAEVIAYVASELLKALEYAHGLCNEEGRPLGIVHRDVSPENVMVSSRGEVKLLDFGVVKATEGRVSKTEVGVVKGNVTYMSPEQARGLEVDARADLYAVALVLFTCCAGRPLHAADTTYGLLMRAGAEPAPEDRAAIQELPKPFAALIERATAARIEDRYQTARDMIAELEPWVRGGASPTAALVTELFGEELKEEAHRLATFIPDSASRAAAGNSG